MPSNLQKKSIRSLSPIKPYVKEGNSFVLALKISEIESERLDEVGCPATPEEGDEFLPSVIGPKTEMNANGREELDRSGEKETLYRMVNRTWNDWHGHPHSGVSAVRYQRWPRVLAEPPEEHLRILKIDEELYITSEVKEFSEGSDSENLHAINVFLECFNECDILDEEGRSLMAPRLKKKNWDLLPRGAYPWATAKGHIRTITSQLSEDEQAVIDHRMKEISKHGPDILALGRGGFRGYFVFGFSDLNIYVMESIRLDNATYVFGTDWEMVSELSKREILSGNLHEERIIHNHFWARKLRAHLRN